MYKAIPYFKVNSLREIQHGYDHERLIYCKSRRAIPSMGNSRVSARSSNLSVTLRLLQKLMGIPDLKKRSI